jgi:hypothetical protein
MFEMNLFVNIIFMRKLDLLISSSTFKFLIRSRYFVETAFGFGSNAGGGNDYMEVLVGYLGQGPLHAGWEYYVSVE